ncbi:MAG: NusG domain II-containing protein [Synergistaceae bacterium]|jgi:hypothetical protein|nr:NusG domain II-containing protein [Synergistaceae bacterium]
MDRKYFAKGDFLLILCLLCVLFAFYFFTARQAEEGEKYAEISVDGRLDSVVALSENGLYAPACRPAVQIAVQDGAIGFVHSDCPDKICIHMGFLSTPGQSAVCLPNRVIVRVAARKEHGLDSTTY